jgi:hypothetical protein
MTSHDPVVSPAHYTVYPVQPIEITRHLSFCLGNAVKYVLRAPYKGEDEDLLKARQYLLWEIETPGPDIPHHAYVQVEAAIEATINHLRRPRSAMSDLQAYFLVTLDKYLSTGESVHLASMLDAVRSMLELPEIKP